MPTADEIRRSFIGFFESHGHRLIAPASIVPDSDPTLLFTIAGMQQFKADYEQPDRAIAPRVITIQPCLRTSDIDEVGDDIHLTVFDMLGFFSFGYSDDPTPDGPYFKAVALPLVWRWYTEQVGFDPSQMRATYFAGDAKRPEDQESLAILRSLAGLGAIDASIDDNFWGPVGASGPCGPCVELYYQGVEVGNVVFNQYLKSSEGDYSPLAFLGVDAGLGLERIVTLTQGKASVYETDIFAAALSLIRTKSPNYIERQGRIIADHAKAALYLLTAGVRPGNKGRDYIARRLIRRATRAGQIVGFDDFGALMKIFGDLEGPRVSSIRQNKVAARTLFDEERRKFLRTLTEGSRQLKKMTHDAAGEISGDQAFFLFESFGFPIELTLEMAKEAGWTVDLTGFEVKMVSHRQTSRASAQKIFRGGLADHDPKTIAHHTAHHLLLAALRQVLGPRVVQRGSNVTSERLRLDISHGEQISDDELRMAEAIVNQKIDEDLPVISEQMDRDAALKSGALAEFGTKYPAKVKVYTIVGQDGQPFSRELCGGPHVSHTGELGQFEIIKEEAAAAGIRRIRARVVGFG